MSLSVKFSATILTFLLLNTYILSGHAEQTADQDASHAQHSASMDWPGVYNGFVPCEDCPGIKTSLALNKNNTYILITQFAAKSPRDYVEKGKYSWDEANKKIELMPKNSSQTKQYLVKENQLVQLDANGNPYTGKDADRYILRRFDQPANAPDSHRSHHGR